MTYHESRTFPVPFGKMFKGQQFQVVAQSDRGLTYLDWMSGLPDLFPKTREALDAFLHEPEIAQRLKEAKEKQAKQKPKAVEPKPAPVHAPPQPARNESFDPNEYDLGGGY